MAHLARAYAPRRPTETVLYGVVRQHLETFLRWARETYESPLPRYVENELRAYLTCGVFAHGFVRARCDACGHDLLVAFSCKGRAACPSCAGRRMANSAAHLVDRVLPPVRVRQYVLTLPAELRALAAFKASALSAIARAFVAAIFAGYRRRARADGLEGAECGAVTFVQRFGGTLNLNVHLHVVVLDGVFTRDESGRVEFHEAPPPTATALHAIVMQVERRVLAWLHRRGLLEDPAGAERVSAESTSALDECASIAMRRGTQMTLTSDDAPSADEGANLDTGPAGLAADHHGFNLHAGVTIGAADDLGRERLCRYGARPPYALERFRRLPGGRIAYRVKYVRRGRAKHRVMRGIELLARLAALIPPPRYPLIRYHGVLAPASSWRKDVVPKPPVQVPPGEAHCGGMRARSPEAGETRIDASAPRPRRGAPPRDSSAPSSPRREHASPDHAPAARPSESVTAPAHHLTPNILSVRHWDRLLGGALYATTPRLDWATLLRRTFDVDILECPTCHGRLRVLGAVTESAAVTALLEQLGVSAAAPKPARARDPTDEDDDAPA